MRSVKRTVGAISRKRRAQLSHAAKPALETLETRRMFSGELDTNFGGSGWVFETFGGDGSGLAVAVEPGTNSVFVAGKNTSVAPGQLIIAKYTAAGVLDNSFSGDGIYDVPLGDNSVAEDIVLSGGLIYVTGTTTTAGDEEIFVLRLDGTGTEDASFDGDGVAVVGGALGQQAFEMLVDEANGHAYVAGLNNGEGTVARFLTTATAEGLALDVTWDTDGFTDDDLGTGEVVTGIAQDSAGDIVVSYNIVSGRLAKFDSSTGNLDAGFGVGGLVTPTADPNATIDEVVVDGTDIYTVGSSAGVAAIQKFDGLGNASGGFDGDGVAHLVGDSGVLISGLGIAFDSSDRVVIAGQIDDTNLFTTTAFVARFDSLSGAQDLTFGVGGIAETAGPGFAGAAEVTTYVDVDDVEYYVIAGVGLDGGTFESGLFAARFVGDEGTPPPSPVLVDLNGNLVVPGTAGDDTFVLTAVGSDVQVQYNGDDAGTFSFTGAILIDGGDGHDSITLDTAITDRAEIFGGLGNDTVVSGSGDDFIEGGDGNDVLLGDNGTDIILGGANNDVISGQGGRDLLIGGLGSDNVSGGADSDLVIAATTDFDGSEASLNAILSVWDVPLPYVLRTVAVRILAFRPSNLNDDGAPDTLLGGAGQDWFILDVSQDTSDRVPGEIQTNV